MKRLPIFLILAILFFGVHTRSNAQGFSLATPASIAAELAQSNAYEISQTIGLMQTPSLQLQRFNRLVSLATEQELVDLATSHSNTVVRLYAYQALKVKKAAIPKALQEKFNADISKVHVVDGCVLEQKTVSFLVKGNLPTPANTTYLAQFN
jgi:hypothetical protein